jgi:hypothetical protein
MSVSPSISTLQFAPAGTHEQLRAELEASGYRCSVASLSRGRPAAPGCTVVLQFGDKTTTNDDGVTCLTVRCGIELNGGIRPVGGGATHWRIRKEVDAPRAIPKLRFAIEADLILGEGISVADILRDGHGERRGDVYRHLHMLMADASITLHDLSVHEQRADAGTLVAASVMRIEARYVGDLAAGRSGLAVGNGAKAILQPASVAMRHLRITRVACDWLKDDILPELASAVRRTARLTKTTRRHSFSNTATESQSHTQSQAESGLAGSSGAEPSCRHVPNDIDAAVTLVPEHVR